ncbi:VOC family protein [Saxibacter everestensis]|uniref:VOC family protein n=1 Tax=Saxibacter everestensis TaxID=2909229 RepID=A0ABY8QTS4_9MICO|nr:VOC family protein [Brevibacteriaceae bacterium ZFBP1038]
MSGRVVHFEIPFDDGNRARSFYADAFGWRIQEMPELSYTAVTSGPTSDQGMPGEPGFVNGGMVQRDETLAAGPVITVDVESIDAALEKIEQLGGSTVVAKEPVGEMGFAAYFKDPEGNVMGLWENAPQG